MILRETTILKSDPIDHVGSSVTHIGSTVKACGLFSTLEISPFRFTARVPILGGAFAAKVALTKVHISGSTNYL
jgi:hypothetical protein